MPGTPDAITDEAVYAYVEPLPGFLPTSGAYRMEIIDKKSYDADPTQTVVDVEILIDIDPPDIEEPV